MENFGTASHGCGRLPETRSFNPDPIYRGVRLGLGPLNCTEPTTNWRRAPRTLPQARMGRDQAFGPRYRAAVESASRHVAETTKAVRPTLVLCGVTRTSLPG